MIHAVENFNVRGDVAFGDLQGAVITSLELNPNLEFRTVWAALTPYFVQVTAGVVGEWSAQGELRFLLNKVVVGQIPLNFGNLLLIPTEEGIQAYEMRGAAVAPSLWFGTPNGGAGDIVLFEVPAFRVKIKADAAQLFLKKRTTTASTNFVYGLRIHSQL